MQQVEGVQTVQVYVRKGDDRTTRSISFEYSEIASQGEVLDKGYAIDGNQARFVVPVDELLDFERKLIEWFRTKGYGITFC